MGDATDRVSIELIDAGEHKDRVVMVLSKVKGLTMPPPQLVQNAPCTIATNVPQVIAEKLQGFLEKAGAMVILESGEKSLFGEDEFSAAAEAEPPAAESASEFPEAGGRDTDEPDVPPAPAPPPLPAAENAPAEETPPGKLQQILAKIPFFAGKKASGEAAAPSPAADAETLEAAPSGKLQGMLAKIPFLTRKKAAGEAVPEASAADVETPEAAPPGKLQGMLAKLPFLMRKKAPAAAPAPAAEVIPAEAYPPAEAAPKKMPDWIAHPAVLIVLGFLLGAIVAGLWGRLSIRTLQNDYEIKMGQQVLKETGDLKQKNGQLQEQLMKLLNQLEQARQTPAESVAPTPGPQELIAALQKLTVAHAQSLANGYDAQKQAQCTQQLLLDGKSTYTYAQVVKKFDPYTKLDVLKSNSLLNPYFAELKIPFTEELKTGATADACNAAALQPLSTPEHHEFGAYYGYWTIQYLYTDGQWVVNPTVLEKNRALYDSSFQRGSPDYAKFRLDTNLFPEFAAPPAP